MHVTIVTAINVSSCARKNIIASPARVVESGQVVPTAIPYLFRGKTLL
jgi:hypothetical protein